MTLRKAEKKAKEIFEKYRENSPPVDVKIIAEDLGAELRYEPFEGDDDISGVLIKKDDTCVIGINSAHAITRQRFSIAHEIGHLILHSKSALFVDKVINRDRKSSLAIDNKEIEANQFAAELLMPRELIRKEINKLFKKDNFVPDKDWLTEKLADNFKVSHLAMEYRLNNLGILVST